MTAVLLSVCGAYGAYLLYTAVAVGWRGLGVGPRATQARRGRARRWLLSVGPDGTPVPQVLAATAALFAVGAAATWAVFGGLLPAVAAGGFAASAPIAAGRNRRDRRRAAAREAWPRMLEEVRLRAGALGRSVPQALFETGRGAPVELRGAFAAAEREWLLTTDFERTTALLRRQLGDATADAALETLLVAHEVGGSGLDRRLAALVEDRTADLQGRKDALSKQAGVRFARRFVLIVPVGMAAAGLSIGTGREAYQTALGQLAVVAGITMVIACWLWAGVLLRLPEEHRILGGDGA